MKTAEEIIEPVVLNVTDPAGVTDYMVSKDDAIKAMKAYAEQFIDAAVTECNKRIIPGHSVQAPTMIGAGEAILKLKEHLK